MTQTYQSVSSRSFTAASDRSNRLCLDENQISAYSLRPSGAIHFTSLMSHVLSPSLSPSLSLLPQMEVSGIWCVLFLQITFHRVRRGQRSRRLGGGGAEQISPELNIIYENIVPSALPSCSQTAPFYGHLKTYKKTMIHQMCISSNFQFILFNFEALLQTILWSVWSS